MSDSRPPSVLPFWLAGARPAVVGHRGAAAHAPENTLASFRAALGADAVETDVQLSSDHALFLLHDDTLERTTDGGAQQLDLARPASSQPWEVLRTLDAGSWFTSEFAGERLALLDDLAALLGRALDEGAPVGLDLEIKSPSAHAARTVVQHVAGALASEPWRRLVEAHTVMVTSFDPEVVELSCALLPVPVGLLTATTPPAENVAELAELGLAALITSHDDLTEPVVVAAHDAGLVVGVYTANEPADWDRLVGLDVDLIVSDDPVRLRAHLSR